MANPGSRSSALRRKLKQQKKENLSAVTAFTKIVDGQPVEMSRPSGKPQGDEFALDTAHAISKPSELTKKQLAALARSERIKAEMFAERAAKKANKQQP
jgi:hypothetical protein